MNNLSTQIDSNLKDSTNDTKNELKKSECSDITTLKENEEIWKDVINCDKYEVSNIGRVRHKKKKHILKLRNNGSGYKMFGVSINKKVKNIFIHRAVLMAFLPNLNSLQLEVHHKDFDKLNNRLDNLEWRTPSENMNCSFSQGRFKKRDVQRSREFKKQWRDGTSSLQNFILSKFKLKNLDMNNIRYLNLIKFFNKQELAELFSVSQYTIKQVTDNDEFYIKIKELVN